MYFWVVTAGFPFCWIMWVSMCLGKKELVNPTDAQTLSFSMHFQGKGAPLSVFHFFLRSFLVSCFTFCSLMNEVNNILNRVSCYEWSTCSCTQHCQKPQELHPLSSISKVFQKVVYGLLLRLAQCPWMAICSSHIVSDLQRNSLSLLFLGQRTKKKITPYLFSSKCLFGFR